MDFVGRMCNGSIELQFYPDGCKVIIGVFQAFKHFVTNGFELINPVAQGFSRRNELQPNTKFKTKFFINPTGRFVTGGPMGDAGLTGRKIIVDTYGGHGAHGGGAFSGKDPSKVDRSAAYASRHIAKNIVGAGLAERCLVQVAYAIGVAEPVSITVNDYGTSKVGPEVLEKAVRQVFDLRPARITKDLDLLRPIYSQTAAYGHFGRNEESFTWERLNKVDQLKDAVKTLA